MSDVLVANVSFTCEVDSRRYTFQKGLTKITAGHPAARLNPQNFEPVDTKVTYGLPAQPAVKERSRKVEAPAEPQVADDE